MYIRRCDRCGAERNAKSLLPIFGDTEKSKETPYPIFSILKVREYREITLCPECEIKLSAWIFEKPVTCCNCDAKEYDEGITWKDGDRDAKGGWVCSLTHLLINNQGREECCPLDSDASCEKQL